MKARITKGGWTWKGVLMNTGDVIDAPSAEWIANRSRDGLAEAAAESAAAPAAEVTAVEQVAPEAAQIEPSETATLPAPRPRGKR